MRKKPNLGPRMEKCADYQILDPAALYGRWAELGSPLWLEIGCGKGRFTSLTAQENPDIFMVGLELVPDALVMAMERAMEMGVENVRFVHGNADGCASFFASGEVDRLFLNFSDPWPSNRHMHRRLTHQTFLDIYREILKPGGEIHLKTDNAPFFEYSLRRFREAGFELKFVTRDLHANGPVGIMTEYEEKFSSQGIPICRCEAVVR